MASILRVLFLAAEADPFVKIGGLGDVAGSLPRSLRSLTDPEIPFEVDIRLVLPYHGSIQRKELSLHRQATFTMPFGSGETRVEVLNMDSEGLPVSFITGDLIAPDGPVYSTNIDADGQKFTFFSLASLELARKLDWSPHVVHANDWHTAPAIYALSLMRENDPFFRTTSTLLGLHNLPYMGIGANQSLIDFGLPPVKDSRLPMWAWDVPLPLALLTADHIVAASPTYAQEILTPEFGSGLHTFLRTRKNHISGILNGLDVQRWDPQTDLAINKNFNMRNLSVRAKNKLALQKEFGLEQGKDSPLIGMVTRMDHQKGVDLVPEAFRILDRSKLPRPFQAIILGTGDAQLETAIQNLEVDFPDRVRTLIRFDAALSHRIFAGADLLLVPSRYEPCGLTQMIAMRYGCVPLGRRTGGLQDTIEDYNLSMNSTGFLFKRSSSHALAQALRRAVQLYSTNPNAWRGLQKRGMSRDFSWTQSAKHYLQLYTDLSAVIHPDFLRVKEEQV